MENITCLAKNCKYNLNKSCTARDITIVIRENNDNNCHMQDTACEKFEPRYT